MTCFGLVPFYARFVPQCACITPSRLLLIRISSHTSHTLTHTLKTKLYVIVETETGVCSCICDIISQLNCTSELNLDSSCYAETLRSERKLTHEMMKCCSIQKARSYLLDIFYLLLFTFYSIYFHCFAPKITTSDHLL